jgi:hypothetical protein
MADESVLKIASEIMTRLYGNNLTCEVTMYNNIKGIATAIEFKDRGAASHGSKY